MPDTPGKRERCAVKAKRRQAKDEKRAARKARRQDPMPRAGDVQIEDRQRDDAGERVDDVGEAQPDGLGHRLSSAEILYE